MTIDPARVHFIGQVPYDQFVRVLQISAAHIYLTYPFVLSWSMVESMATGCLLIGSDTPPVREVLQEGKNGLLVDFFSPQSVADRVEEVLKNPEKYKSLRQKARQTVLERYQLADCLARHVRLIEDVAERRFPPRQSAPTKRSQDFREHEKQAGQLEDRSSGARWMWIGSGARHSACRLSVSDTRILPLYGSMITETVRR